MINEENVFWTDNGSIRMLHMDLLKFIESKGYVQVLINEHNHVLAKMENNRLCQVNDSRISTEIKDYLVEIKRPDVLEVFIKGLASYTTSKKLDLLKLIDNIDDRDGVHNSRFYFNNCYCEITADNIENKDYEELQTPIWEKRIISKNYNSNPDKGDFEQFCINITGNDPERLLGLKTILGYLMHRNKEVGEPKAIIFYDEKMGEDQQAHGGTGKTLLSMALSACREVETFDAKNIKEGNWFKNQRIQLTTDIIVYDDLKRNYSFENFFPMITSDLEIERKREKAFTIEFSKSPKMLISSNYVVTGPGGDSDTRRRHEFELCNHYTQKFTPEMDFGKRFFGTAWDDEEWGQFYYFMMSCCQDYLKHGLLEVESINIVTNKINQSTSPEFIEFANNYFPVNERLDKRESLTLFKSIYPIHEDLTSHMFTKWSKDYALNSDYKFNNFSSGGNYFFEFVGKETNDEL